MGLSDLSESRSSVRAERHAGPDRLDRLGAAVTLGDKHFTEQFILGELYAEALRAKGYTVHLESDIGPSGVIDAALIRGRIDLYPEYAGVIISALQNITLAAPGAPAPAQAPPRSAQQAYEQAAAFEDGRGFTLLNPRRSRTPTASPRRPLSPRHTE